MALKDFITGLLVALILAGLIIMLGFAASVSRWGGV